MENSYVFSLRGLQCFAEDSAAEGEGTQVSGVTEAAAGPQSEAAAESDPGGEFEKLIRGRYKAEYDARVKSTIQQRLKGSRETVEKYRALEPTIAILEKKYGVEAGDLDALSRAIREECDPQAEGKPEDTAEEERTRMVRQGADRIYTGWMQEAEQLRKVYPDFDFRGEMANPRFVELLRSRVDVKTAYEVVHKDEIIPAAMAYAAKTVEQKLAGKFRSAGSRPAENGMNSQGAVLLGNDVSRLSKKEIADVCRRVERGERVSFG